MVPFHFLMSFMLVFSTVMITSSSSWISMWVAFEVNTLAFMPLMKSKGASKYFLSQSLGSALILSGAAFSSDILVVLGAMVKAGVAPVHSWLPQVMEHLSWKLCLVLSTWQKIGPMCVVFCFCESSFLYFFAVSSLVMGALGALKQSHLRGVLAYSSITHMGWTLCGVTISVSVGAVYFIIYCIVSLFVMVKLSSENNLKNIMKDISFIMLFFSMSGLPPFLGLFPKMWVFLGSPYLISVVLMMSSVMMIFVYTSVMFSSLGKIFKLYSGSSMFIVLGGMFFMA